MRILLVGAGGYGALYVRELLGNDRTDVVWEGIVDPYVSSSSEYAAIKSAGIPVYDTMDAFYKEHSAELAVICTPPFLHREQSIKALENGSFVLCEKPVAPTLEEAQAMQAAEQAYGRFIAVGYQWSYSEAIQRLKQDVLSGVLGAPVSFKTIISWPRNFAYYRRGGGWGGRIEKNGLTVLDSIASNACAHYLHNMLFLLGEGMEESAYATAIEADCLRANEIETFDTCTIRAVVKGVPIYFAATHAGEKNQNPAFLYTFENATVSFSEDRGSMIRAVFSDGKEACYGNPFENTFKKLWDCVDAIEKGETPICTVKTACAHTKLIGELHKSVPYRAFSKEAITLTENGDGVYVPGLLEKLCRAYEEEKLFSEL
ncbi:MAG: Gfo/Idh/MocA family oxidoreductase [Ruminococcaceae bacterium]|nr:Gfo/Idh/MocA family oxidoreductase [Oscillospiraceae bacterium]